MDKEKKKKINWIEFIRIIIAILSGIVGGAGSSALM